VTELERLLSLIDLEKVLEKRTESMATLTDQIYAKHIGKLAGGDVTITVAFTNNEVIEKQGGQKDEEK